MKTIDFLDRVKEAHSLPSDYALAPFLGVSRAQVSKYRNHKDYLSDVTAIRIAELLGLDAGYVMACIHAERSSNDETRAVWEQVADKMSRMGHVAALGFLAFVASLFIGGGPDGAAMAKVPTASPAADNAVVCALCK